MATSKKKNAPFTGKVGNTVTYLLNGQWVKRTIGKNDGPPTVLQLATRMMLSLLANLFKPVKGLINVGFALQAKNTTKNAHNIATIENKLVALKGNYPNLEINYPGVIFSKGTMPVNPEMEVSIMGTGLIFTWDAELLMKGMHPSDRVIMIAYCPEKKYAFYEVDGARREEGSDYLPLLRYRESVIIHTYAAFISANKKNISTTVYTGEFLW
ncbi:MAG: DUF6266 family protein [Pedobacter sp.]|uniref:DUF6266 family protein n=1 Tax=Pedobacter sp. TaxID=1411316 RepID=UPI003399C6BC